MGAYKIQGIARSLRNALENEDISEISNLLKKGDLANVPLNRQNQTALHFATIKRNKEIIDEILNHGGDWKKVDSRGYTVLHMAIENLNSNNGCPITILKIFLDLGFPVDSITNKHRKTTLRMACENKLIDVAKFLIKRGANINNCDDNGICLLRMLIELCNTHEKNCYFYERHYADLIKSLLSHGPDVDCEKVGDKKIVELAMDYKLDKSILFTLFYLTKDEDFLIENKDYVLYVLVKFNKNRVNIYNKVKYLIAKSASVDKIDKEGNTPLRIAMEESSNIEMIYMMLQNSKNIDNYDINGMTELHVMLENHEKFLNKWETYIKVIKTLISKGANVNKEIRATGVTAGHLAAKYMLINVLNILQYCKFDFKLLANKGESLLHYFSNRTTSGNKETLEKSIVDLLIEKGCNVNAINKNGLTPLHYAAQHNRIHLAECLLKHGASLKIKTNESKMTVLHYVFQTKCNNDEEIKEETGLESRRKEMIKLLVNNGAHVNATDKNGMTALLLACKFADESLVKLLLIKGANVNCREKILQRTPLHLAMKKDSVDIRMIEVLINFGASVNARDKDCMTALLLAFELNNISLIKLLLSKGADVNCQDKHLRKTPFHIAVEKNMSMEVIEILLHYGANVDIGDKDGMTVLHVAANLGNESLVKVLLLKGANVTCQDKIYRRTSLHIAVEKNMDVSVIELLLQSGADVNSKMLGGLTPLHLIPRKGVKVMLKLIEFGAEIDAHDDEGRLPIHFIMEIGDRTCLKSLFSAGADLNDVSFAYSVPFVKFIARAPRTRFDRFGPNVDVGLEIMKQITRLNEAKLYISEVYQRYTVLYQGLDDFGKDCVKNNNLWKRYMSMLCHDASEGESKCKLEIKEMKKYMITDSMSLYDVLHLHPSRRFIYTENEIFKNLVSKTSKIESLFPEYCGIIRTSFRESINRKMLLVPAKIAFNDLCGIDLPDLCAEGILYYCDNQCLRMLFLSVK